LGGGSRALQRKIELLVLRVGGGRDPEANTISNRDYMETTITSLEKRKTPIPIE